MIILGISDSIESHACVLKDGKLIGAVAEERFSRLKSDTGYPKKSIDYLLKYLKIRSTEIDKVVFAGFDNGIFQTIYKPNAKFSVFDWVKQNDLYWKPKLYQNKKLSEYDDFKIWEKVFKDIKKDIYYPMISKIKKSKKNPKNFVKIFNDHRIKTVIKHLKIHRKKISVVRHETCHQIYGYYSQQNIITNPIILTLEGGGDDSSATISFKKKIGIYEKYKTNEAMMGRLYRYITLLLGMKPGQHEYKVMGLAPYGTPYHGTRALNFFRKFNSILNYKIKNLRIFKDCYYSSKKHLEGERFDGIAWGLQTYLEEFLQKWITNCVKHFKRKDIILSGGVAQNIKAIKCLSENKKVNSVWAGPISGDGSLAIGAVWHEAEKHESKKIKFLKDIYLGTEIENNDILKELKRIKNKFIIKKNISNLKIASWISKGFIIARCKGRMEFGQRALGNRSILADPRYFQSVEKINQKIKYRDFWMPFTPSILFEECNKIIVNPKKFYSPFMTMAFDVRENFIDKIPAVIHPADKTTRPQMLRKQDNADYYDLISKFKSITKLPLLLNTSFNLHGDAIVENARQAVLTFEKSELDALILNDYLIVRSKEMLKK